jgi:hypothetical protein
VWLHARTNRAQNGYIRSLIGRATFRRSDLVSPAIDALRKTQMLIFHLHLRSRKCASTRHFVKFRIDHLHRWNGVRVYFERTRKNNGRSSWVCKTITVLPCNECRKEEPVFFLFERIENVWTLVKAMRCAAHTDIYCQPAS